MYKSRNGDFRYDDLPRLCENGKNAHLGRPIVSPACFRETEATKRVTIQYNDVETDVLELCDDCAKLIKKSVRRHGYKVRTMNI